MEGCPRIQWKLILTKREQAEEGLQQRGRERESKDDQGGLTDEEEPGDVSPEPGAGSKHLDMGKQAGGRGLDNEGSEEEEANG
ncbi:hypothetical protein PAXRUDRAFT_22375 [Paxillus rubicundulus Ve08.2h10]|uniref:Uncharacterized protein n=1 Tax=Paxillus rubicundulus Ve08.2h10 TaxID=930991 RepID=A0A0D0CXK5_9AGAM|nr:hypothetical protein PAXRUDRAFT_22375 [Paxillus rubicundulus Ve08.2h10]